MTPIPAYWLAAPVTAALVITALVSERGQPRQVWPGDAGQNAAADSAETAIERELDARLRIILDRVSRKNGHASRLIDGTATLADVVAAFARLNRQDPVVTEVLRLQHPGLSEEECAARNVIGYVRARNLPADRHAAVMARLREEYLCLRGSEPGENHLPVELTD